jgi:hypothetical protein
MPRAPAARRRNACGCRLASGGLADQQPDSCHGSHAPLTGTVCDGDPPDEGSEGSATHAMQPNVTRLPGQAAPAGTPRSPVQAGHACWRRLPGSQLLRLDGGTRYML